MSKIEINNGFNWGKKIIYRKFLIILIFPLIPFLINAQSINEEINFLRVQNFLTSLSASNLNFSERILLDTFGSFGRSIIVSRINESNDDFHNLESGTLILALPLYSDFAVDVAILLSEKLEYMENSNIIIAFLGDEYISLPEHFGGMANIGLRDLLSLSEIPENWVILYLDSDEIPDKLILSHGNSSYITPREILHPFVRLLNSSSMTWQFNIWFHEIYNLGIIDGPEILSIIWSREINSIYIYGEESNQNKDNVITPDSIVNLVIEFSNLLDYPVLLADTHYSLFPLPGSIVLFTGEGLLSFFAFFICGLFLLIFFIYSIRFYNVIIFHARLFIKYIWLFIILLPLLVFSIRFSGFFYSFLYNALDGPSSHINYIGFIFSAILVLIIFYFPSPFLNLIRIPRKIQFLGSYAVLLIISGLILTLFMDFSLVFIFLWALIFVFIGSISLNPIIVFISSFMIPVFALGIIINIAFTGGREFSDLFITSNWNNIFTWSLSFIVSLLGLPLLLLLKKGSLLLKRKKENKYLFFKKMQFRIILLPNYILLLILTMFIQIQFLPQEQHLIIRQIEAEDDFLNLNINNNVFQETRIIELEVHAYEQPVRFDIILESINGDILPMPYSSKIPFNRGNDGRTIRFLTGEHPPNPLSIEFTVPLYFNCNINVSAIYLEENDAGNDSILIITGSEILFNSN